MLLINLFIILSVLFAEQDTLIYNIEDITIQSDKHKLSKIIINESDIMKRNSTDIADAINGQNGISIRDYGGAGGMKMISLRASTANQIAYIYDGFKINDKSSGSVNSALFNTNNISSIEIDKTGTSSIYGSNSLFGNIIFNSKIPQNKQINFNIGSFNNYAASVVYPINNTTSISFDYKNNTANYPIKIILNNKEEELERNNSKLINYNFNFTKLFINNNISHKIRYFFNYNEQGIPGAVLQDKLENTNAKLTTNNNYLYYNNYIKLDDYTINNGFFYNYSELNYKDTLNKLFNKNGIDNNYFTNNVQLFSELINNNNLINYRLRIDNDYTYLRGDNLLNNSNIEGNIFGASLNFDKVFEINKYKLLINFGARYDIINYTKNNISPLLSITFLSDAIKSTISYSRNFRAPSFNEMYYLNFGNSNLKPELSNSINFYNKININKHFTLNINPYYSIIDDYIQSIPISPVVWSASNLEKVNNYGLESELVFNYKKLNINFNYTYQKAKFIENTILNNTDLPYIPNELISSNIYFEHKIVNTNLLLNYNSFRYYNQGNDVNSVIDSFLLLDLVFNKLIKINKNEFKIIFSIKNILDSEYQIINNFPMPGINFLLTLNYGLKWKQF